MLKTINNNKFHNYYNYQTSFSHKTTLIKGYWANFIKAACLIWLILRVLTELKLSVCIIYSKSSLIEQVWNHSHDELLILLDYRTPMRSHPLCSPTLRICANCINIWTRAWLQEDFTLCSYSANVINLKNRICGTKKYNQSW